MIFIVARTYLCAVGIARREGLAGPRAMSWLTSTMMHKIMSLDEPNIWIADCGLELLSAEDKDLIIARRSHLMRVTCSE
jgi:hypothetical protein